MTTTPNPFGVGLNATLNVLRMTLRDLGHDLPDSLASKLAAADAAARVPDSLQPDPAKAARRWVDLYAEGKDPSRDPEILGLLTRSNEAVRALEMNLQQLAEQTKAEALTEAADPIVKTLKGVVKQAQKDIDEARTQIGTAITRTSTAGLNPDGHRAHAVAQEAYARTDLAQRAWVTLAKYTGRASWRPGHVETLLVLADLDLDDLAEIADRVRLARTGGGVGARLDKLDARTLVDAGNSLDLADFATFTERKARVTVEAERQRDAELSKRKKAFDGIDPTRLHPARA